MRLLTASQRTRRRASELVPFAGVLVLGMGLLFVIWRPRSGPLSTKHLTESDARATASSSPSSEVDLGAPGRPVELVSGWWGKDSVPEGVGGRWTGREATLRLLRRDDEGGLGMAVTFASPEGVTRGSVDVTPERSEVEPSGFASAKALGNGEQVFRFESGRGRRTLVFDIRGIRQPSLTVRFTIDNPFVPLEHGLGADRRLLGMMVHAAWLQKSPVASEVELGWTQDGRPELVSGWWERERWPDGRTGRWTAKEASLLLERRGEEKGLLVELTSAHPEGLTTGRIEVGGRAFPFRASNGERSELLDVGGLEGSRVVLRFVVDKPFGAEGRVGRSLGIFVHSVRLVEKAASGEVGPTSPKASSEGRLASQLTLGSVEDKRPELVSGWWSRETWPDGTTGRWTREEASVRLSRFEDETRLLVDMSFAHPTNLTTGWIEVNGRRLLRLRSANRRVRQVLDLGAVPGSEILIRFVAERPFVGGEHDPETSDARRLGFFVHEVRVMGPRGARP